MKGQIAKWRSESLPDIEIDILRVLYNNRQHEMSAVEIGNEVDRHHLAITKIMEKLSKREYERYYRVSYDGILSETVCREVIKSIIYIKK